MPPGQTASQKIFVAPKYSADLIENLHFVEQFVHITWASVVRRPAYRTDSLHFIFRKRTFSSRGSESSWPYRKKVDSHDKFHHFCSCVRRHDFSNKNLPVILFCHALWSCICLTFQCGFRLFDGVAASRKSHFFGLTLLFNSISCWGIKCLNLQVLYTASFLNFAYFGFFTAIFASLW
jgi:hypothetical protein